MAETTDLYREMLKLLYIFSFSLGLWTCLSVTVNKRCPREAKRSLLLFIGILLIIPLNGYLSLIADETPEIFNSLSSTISWCYGPLMWVFVNCVVQKQQKSRHLLLHFIPFFLITIVHLSWLQWLNFYLYQGLLGVQMAVYLFASFNTIFKYRQKIAVLGKEFKNSSYYWMLYLIAGLAVIAIYEMSLAFILQLGIGVSFYFVATTVCAFSVYISAISIFLLIQPDTFSQGEEPKEAPVEEKKPEPSADKLRKVELSAEAAKELGESLEKLMKEHKPYLETDISLGKLAALLGVSNHQLSELLNIHMETSFYDYLNSLRYKEAIRLMETDAPRHSVTDIAYLSGFNNRNSFYRVFKQNSGLTPGEYRKQRSTAG